MLRKPRSYMLLKTDLGRVKTGFHNLPNQSHVYGKSPIPDKYNARSVINNWKQHEQSPLKTPGIDYITINRDGVKFGCTSTEEFNSFRRSNQKRLKVNEGQKHYLLKVPNDEFVFGIKNRPSTPIKNVICNVYGNEQIELQKQRSQVLATLKNGTTQRYCVSSDKKLRMRTARNLFEQKDYSFKMSKFRNVPSKVKRFMTKSSTNVLENKQNL